MNAATSGARAALRGFARDRFVSAVHLLGLALGLACCFLIYLFVAEETEYDRWMDSSDRLYRLATPKGGQLPPLLGQLVEQLPEVEQVVRVHGGFVPLIVHGDTRTFESVHFVDGNFPDVFDIEFIHGDPATALHGFRTMVISEEVAARHFGDRDPRGEIFRWDGSFDYEITGVARVPERSHIEFNILASISSMADQEQFHGTGQQWREAFTWSDHFHYLLLTPKADVASLPDKIAVLIRQIRGEEAAQIVERWGGFILQPVPDIHLHSRLPIEIGSNGRIEQVYLAVAIAAIVLLVASINYVNLSVARSTKRASEIGVRKALGAGRGQLIWQFLGESVLMTWLAFAVSLGMVQLVMPWYSEFFQTDGSITAVHVVSALAGATAIGLLSGLYPAFVLSMWRPSSILRGERTGARSLVRQGLASMQFGVSVSLVIATGVVFAQLHYIEQRDLGYSTDRTLLITTGFPSVYQRMVPFQQDLRSLAGVEATASYWQPMGESFTSYSKLHRDGVAEGQPIWMNNVEPRFFDLFELPLVAGRGFDSEIASDVRRVIILNESSVAALGFDSAQQALGQQVRCTEDCFSEYHTIIGVTRDAHFESLREPIGPVAFVHAPPVAGTLAVRLGAGRVSDTLARIEAAWSGAVPEFPMMYRFLDNDMHALYEADRRVGRLLAVFAGIAVLIACVGALAMVLFTTQQRTSEIGLRKALGAEVWQLLALLSKDAVRPVLIGSLVALPLTWLGARAWLQEFAYHTDLSVGLFVGGAALVLVLVLATVLTQTSRAARANPADALKPAL